jgi:hypothetical protein
MDADILEYYNRGGEDNRLAGTLELLRTKVLLSRYLPPSADVLDVGGASGARALDEPDASRDVVLLLGPLYHLPDRADRVRALAEATRVSRGLVVAAAISRWAPLYFGMLSGEIDSPLYTRLLREDLATGTRRAARSTSLTASPPATCTDPTRSRARSPTPGSPSWTCWLSRAWRSGCPTLPTVCPIRTDARCCSNS